MTDLFCSGYRVVPLSLVVALSAVIAACTDEDPVSRVEGGKEAAVQFDVRDSRDWHSRGNSNFTPAAAMKPLLLDGAVAVNDAPLYLVPKVEQGISLRNSNSVLSRSVLTDANSISDFGVFASMRSSEEESLDNLSPTYMCNERITRDNDWKPLVDYMWPGEGMLHINAYSPYVSLSDSNSGDGVVSLPQCTDTGELTLNFVSPENVGDQFDLLYSVPCDASSSPCEITFEHALTAIKFAAGSELVPCTVRSIEVSGISSRAVLNLENGEWSDYSELSDYKIYPDKLLSPSAGETFVPYGAAITSDTTTLLVIPQTLTSNSAIKLTIGVDGRELTFEASLEGQKWNAGQTVTYYLSANPEIPDLIFQVLDSDGNPVSRLTIPYTGGTTNYSVRSRYTSSASPEVSVPVEWEARFIDSNGQIIPTPERVLDYTISGNGDTDCSMTIDLPDPKFIAVSEATDMLRKAGNINSASGFTPYNLANRSGASAVENTANCYVINAPGRYSFPLVYGNAVKDGADNPDAYRYNGTLSASEKRHMLPEFINHLGNAITDPYIYNNAGCSPAAVELLWESRLKLITNLALSSDGRSVEFDVTEETIRQGNALIALEDNKGNVMWSWQIWVTDYNPRADMLSFSYHDHDFRIYRRNLGEVHDGDIVEFTPAIDTLEFVQKNVADGMTPLSIKIAVVQDGKTVRTTDSYSFYQWGRKDPMISGVTHFYNVDHHEIDGFNIPSSSVSATHLELIKDMIKSPELFFTDNQKVIDRYRTYYVNLWNSQNCILTPDSLNYPKSVKSIYDPCPVGAKIPVGNAMYALSKYPMTYDSGQKGAVFNLGYGENNPFFFTLGYRSPSSGEARVEATGAFWTAVSPRATLARYLVINTTECGMQNFSPLYGFGVRPVADD